MVCTRGSPERRNTTYVGSVDIRSGFRGIDVACWIRVLRQLIADIRRRRISVKVLGRVDIDGITKHCQIAAEG